MHEAAGQTQHPLHLRGQLGLGQYEPPSEPLRGTPTFDQLFSQGTEFCQFHVNAPVCSPSRAALYTGQFPGRNKVFWSYENAQENRKYGLNDWLDPELVLLPRLMKKAGYVTGHYGKWHLGNVQSSPALEQYGIDDGRCWCGPPPTTWGHDTVYKETMDFIRQHKDVPFFMNLWIRETHTPHWLHNETLELPWIKTLPEDERVYAAVAWEADQWIGKFWTCSTNSIWRRRPSWCSAATTARRRPVKTRKRTGS